MLPSWRGLAGILTSVLPEACNGIVGATTVTMTRTVLSSGAISAGAGVAGWRAGFTRVHGVVVVGSHLCSGPRLRK